MLKAKRRVKNRDNSRRAKKKVSLLSSEGIEYVDWKDTNLLRRFVSDRSKIRARRVTGNSAQQQKLIADAIKVAREMALIPYATRVTTQRQYKERDGRGRPDGRPSPRSYAAPEQPAGDTGGNGAAKFVEPAEQPDPVAVGSAVLEKTGEPLGS